MSNADDDDDIQEVIPVKSEPKEITAVSAPHGGVVGSGGAGPVGVGGGHVPGPGAQHDQYDDSQQVILLEILAHYFQRIKFC